MSSTEHVFCKIKLWHGGDQEWYRGDRLTTREEVERECGKETVRRAYLDLYDHLLSSTPEDCAAAVFLGREFWFHPEDDYSGEEVDLGEEGMS